MARSAAPRAPALVVLLMSAMAMTALAFAPPFAPLLAPVGPSARAAAPGCAHPRLRSRLPPARPSLLPPGRHACGVHKRRQSLQWSVQMAADGAGDPGEGITANDRKYMDRALELARQGEGRTFPNPCVGCVLVKDGEVVGEGFHPKAGMPHAEIYALYMAGERAKGATAYVTLEPCNHFGRTPPCSQAFVDAQVNRLSERSRARANDRQADVHVLGARCRAWSWRCGIPTPWSTARASPRCRATQCASMSWMGRKRSRRAS